MIAPVRRLDSLSHVDWHDTRTSLNPQLGLPHSFAVPGVSTSVGFRGLPERCDRGSLGELRDGLRLQRVKVSLVADKVGMERREASYFRRFYVSLLHLECTCAAEEQKALNASWKPGVRNAHPAILALSATIVRM